MLDTHAAFAAMHIDGGAYETVASDNERMSASWFWARPASHRHIYLRFTFCIILMLK
jgi:hypothetical protein